MKEQSKLNICYIARSLNRHRDNAEIEPFFLNALTRELKNLDHKVTVVGISNEDLIKDIGGISYVLVKKQKKIEPKKLIFDKFLKLHNENKFHIVHIVDRSGLLVAKNKKASNIKIVLDIRATQMSQLFYIISMGKETVRSMIMTFLALTYKYLSTYFSGDRQLLKNANGVFVSSPRQRLVLERYYFYPDSRIHTLPFGNELGKVYKKHKSKLNISDDSLVALTITDMKHLGVMKNILKAFEFVAIKIPNARLVIIGNGPKKFEIEAFMYKLALGSRVTLTGNIPHSEVISYVERSNVFIDINIKSTGFDPALLEAMANEKVIIGSEISAISSIIQHGVTGFLLRPADTNALSELLLKIFNGSIETMQIGKRAKEKISNLFDPKNMVNSMIESYQKMLLD